MRKCYEVGLSLRTMGAGGSVTGMENAAESGEEDAELDRDRVGNSERLPVLRRLMLIRRAISSLATSDMSAADAGEDGLASIDERADVDCSGFGVKGLGIGDTGFSVGFSFAAAAAACTSS